MCLLWVLLQFVVMAMRWEVPPVSSVQDGAVMVELKRKEDEEVPLMESDEDLSNTYRTVNSNPTEGSTSSEPPLHDASAVSKPFKKFSASKGEHGRMIVSCPLTCL